MVFQKQTTKFVLRKYLIELSFESIINLILFQIKEKLVCIELTTLQCSRK